VGSDETIFHIRQNSNPTTDFNVLFFGKYIPLHGIDIIMNAAKILEPEKIYFTIIGYGQLSKEVSALNRTLKLKNVQFIDWVPYKILPDYIEKADVGLGIFGNTTKANNVIPNKVFNILSMSKPLITGNSPAIEFFRSDKKEAILCKMGNSNSIVEAILMLKNNPDLKNSIAKNGYYKFKNELTAQILGNTVKTAITGL